jgi:predicted helicase
MDLHIGYETVAPFELERVDAGPSPRPSPRKRGEGAAERSEAPKPMLKADREAGRIVLDTQTALVGIPPEAWDYKLGNRSALEWILDQYKEKKPKDPTIRAKFNTYRFADYRKNVIDLLARVTTVSVETQRIVAKMERTCR